MYVRYISGLCGVHLHPGTIVAGDAFLHPAALADESAV